MKTLTHSELITLLSESVNGLTFIGLTTETTPVLAGGKKNPYQNKLVKRTSDSNVMVFQNKTGSTYDKMVKRRLTAEGKDPDTFNLSDRKWGVRVPNTPLITHKEQYYLEVIFLRAGFVEYFDLNGREVDVNDIDGLEKAVSEDAQGGLDNLVVIRTYKLNSIKRIIINKEEFVITQ